MTFKRHTDRLPIIPPDAREHNVVCQFCIVGCGYHPYTWDINQQGGPAPSQNKFGVDLSKQQEAMTANWYSPAMYNIVKQDGKDVHLVIKPDPACSVNSGLGSIRGARMAEESFSEARSTQQQRLTEPMVWRYSPTLVFRSTGAPSALRSDSPDRVQRDKRSRRLASARLGCLLLPQPKNRLPGSQRLPYHQKPTLRLGRRKRQRMPGKTSPSSGLQIQLPQASGKRREFDLKEGKFVCHLN